jgi:hypothetical protein
MFCRVIFFGGSVAAELGRRRELYRAISSITHRIYGNSASRYDVWGPKFKPLRTVCVTKRTEEMLLVRYGDVGEFFQW